MKLRNYRFDVLIAETLANFKVIEKQTAIAYIMKYISLNKSKFQ